MVGAHALRLLGGHVLGRAQHHARRGQARRRRPRPVSVRDLRGDAEVDDLDQIEAAVLRQDEDVGGLQVAVFCSPRREHGQNLSTKSKHRREAVERMSVSLRACRLKSQAQ